MSGKKYFRQDFCTVCNNTSSKVEVTQTQFEELLSQAACFGTLFGDENIANMQEHVCGYCDQDGE